MVTEEVMKQLEDIWKKLGDFIDLVGLFYDSAEDEYVCYNRNQVDEDWCDREMLEDIENAREDIGYFLGKW